MSASNFGCLRSGRFGGSGCGSVLASCFFSSGFLSFSAIGSGFGSGSGSGVFSAVALISFFSVSLGAGVSAGLGSSFFSTRGLGISALGASLAPLIISEKSFSLTRSTGSDSAGVTSKVLPVNDTTAHSSTAACRLVEITDAVFISIILLSSPARIR
ncbi:MAG: hypothetical protein EXQ82_05660 [Pseudolabrys sp.]|nr:hypothetical protein [Pseudolabrys sp.]